MVAHLCLVFWQVVSDDVNSCLQRLPEHEWTYGAAQYDSCLLLLRCSNHAVWFTDKKKKQQ